MLTGRLLVGEKSMAEAAVTLDDKYTLDKGRVFITGVQALARLPMVQRQRDVLNGLNTAGFISGYRGSPLGGYDQQLWNCLLYTSPSPRDSDSSRMPSSA